MLKLKIILPIFIFLFISTESFSYIGPGMGGGLIAVILGMLFAFIAAFFSVIYFPIKRYFKNKKKKSK